MPEAQKELLRLSRCSNSEDIDEAVELLDRALTEVANLPIAMA